MRLTRPVACLLILVALATLGALAVRRSVARTQLSRLGVEPLLYTARPLGPTRQYGVLISGRHVDDEVFESVLDLLPASGYTHRAITLEAVSVSGKSLTRLLQLDELGTLTLISCDAVSENDVQAFRERAPRCSVRVFKD